MNVWILQTGEPLHIDTGNPRPMRAMNLANALIAAGHNVVLWSSAFYHQEKKHRSRVAETIHMSPQLEIRLIPSSGYQRNIGLGRLWDHAILAIHLRKQLRQEKTQPDVAFIGYPPIEVAAIMTRWLTVRGIPSVLDVKDQWPNIFVEALPRSLQPIGRIAFAPYFYLAKRAMRDATGISAMADSFLEKTLLFADRKRSLLDDAFPLTPSNNAVSAEDLIKANEWWDQLGIHGLGKLRLCYIGNLSPNVDLEPLKSAAYHFLSKSLPVEFVICGDGVSLEKYKVMMLGLNNVHFPGRINQAHALAITLRSQASLIPYVNSENFQLSLPNKSIDSLSYGLPILSSLQGEVASLIENYNVGLRYGADSGQSLIDCIEKIINQPDLCEEMSRNALSLYREKFSYEIVYGKLVTHLENMLVKSKNG